MNKDRIKNNFDKMSYNEIIEYVDYLETDYDKLQKDIYILLDVINKNVEELDCNDTEFKTITYYIDKINKKGGE